MLLPEMSFIVLVLFIRAFAYSQISSVPLCDVVGRFCKVQCNYGGDFQKRVCIEECTKNAKTCEYVKNCVVSDDSTNLQNNYTVEPGAACFLDYAYEYFCNHIYYPCMIECLSGDDKETQCRICKGRKSFCECGLQYYLSSKQYTATIVPGIPLYPLVPGSAVQTLPDVPLYPLGPGSAEWTLPDVHFPPIVPDIPLYPLGPGSAEETLPDVPLQPIVAGSAEETLPDVPFQPIVPDMPLYSLGPGSVVQTLPDVHFELKVPEREGLFYPDKASKRRRTKQTKT